MFFDIIVATFTIGLLAVPLSSDYSQNRVSKFYNKIILTLFRVPEKYLITEYGKYRYNGSLASKQYFYSGNLLKEIHYLDDTVNPYATYYYDESILSRVEFYSEGQVTAMNLDEGTPKKIPFGDR